MLTIVASLSGCANNRRWGPCALAGGLLGGAIGALGAGYGVEQFEPGPTNAETFGGAAAGGAAGMLIGTVLGHYICDPEEESSASSRGR
jgi:hypothetical protein